MSYIYEFGSWAITYLILSTCFILVVLCIEHLPYFKTLRDRISLWRLALIGSPIVTFVVLQFNTGFIHYYACPKTINDIAVSNTERMLFASSMFGSINQSVPFYFDFSPMAVQGFAIAFFVFWLLTSIGMVVHYALDWFHITKKLNRLNQFSLDDFPNMSRIDNYLKASKLTLYLLERTESPYAFGKKSIGIPKIFLDNFTEEQLLCVLAHENSHIKNRDDIWFIIAKTMNILLFFQPFNRLALSKLKDLTEERSDQDACVLIGNKKTVAETLLAAAEIISTKRLNTPRVALFKKRKKLLRRVELIMTSNTTPTKRFSIVFAVITLFMISLFVPVIKMGDRDLNQEVVSKLVKR